jgi:murein DD-endopeptidase MepM/ murein hydrolase activator NlpD
MHPKLTRSFVASIASCILLATAHAANARIATGGGAAALAANRFVAEADSPLEAAGEIFARATQSIKIEDLQHLTWPVPDKTINTPFTGEHSGIDIEGETGDPITAAASGVVRFAGDDGDGYGLKVVIRHDDKVSTLYSHLADITVKKGRVERGEKIGTVGCTGSCSGDHLHFEVRTNGTPTDPTRFLKG